MRKTLRVFVILVIGLLMMVSCSNDDLITEENGDNTNESESETDQPETDEVADEDSDLKNDNDEELPETSADDEVPVLELGETGVIEDTLGTYEVTATGFSFETEMTADDPYQYPDNGIFVLVDVTIKNIGSTILDSGAITNTNLYRDLGDRMGAGSRNTTSFVSIDYLRDQEIEPGETISGQLLFNLSEEEYYELAFGANMPEHISNEVRWALHAEDAE